MPKKDKKKKYKNALMGAMKGDAYTMKKLIKRRKKK
jgi:hypothetical protein